MNGKSALPNITFNQHSECVFQTLFPHFFSAKLRALRISAFSLPFLRVPLN